MLCSTAPVPPHTVLVLVLVLSHGDHDHGSSSTGLEISDGAWECSQHSSVCHCRYSLCLTSEKDFWGNLMGNQRTARISAGVRSQSSKDVVLFFLSSPRTWYPWQVQLYPIFACWQQGKKKIDLVSYWCSPAVIQLEKPCLRKINSVKHCFTVLLLEPLPLGDGNAGLCWPCAYRTAPNLLLHGGMNLKRGANCGRGLTGCPCLRGKGVVSLQKQSSERTQGNLNDPG